MTATPIVGSTFFGLDVSQVATRLLSMRRRISKRVLMLEFGPDFLLLAEATLSQMGVKLSHVSSFALPPDALDRGVPAEPLKMAGLIKDFCAEKKIPAHRAAVVLPPELAFQRLLNLPASLTTDEACDYVLNPSNGLQIPFPLTQTDFDLFPVCTPAEQQQDSGTCLYMLTAIPEVLVDSIVEMLQAADLELQLLELGSHSQLRNHAADLITLAPQQVDLVLELTPDCSNLMLVSSSGLLGSERLAAIRNLPEINLEPDELAVARESGLTPDHFVLKDENYLPISELDLRVLVADLRASLERFYQKLPGAQIRRLILTGVNSSHPILADLLIEMMGLHVVVSRPGSVNGLAELSTADFLLPSGLTRLTGLALGLLPKEQLLTCCLEGRASKSSEPQLTNEAVAIADLLSSSVAQTGLDLVAVQQPIDHAPVAAEEKQEDSMFVVDTDMEASSSLESSVLEGVDASTETADQSDALVVTPIDDVEDQELTTSLITSLSLEEDPLVIDLDEMQSDSAPKHEDPSRSLPEADLLLDPVTADDADSSEEQWPSIKAPVSGGGDVMVSETVPDSLDLPSLNDPMLQEGIDPSVDASLPDTEWPSIASVEPVVQDLDIDLESEGEDDASRWPSIALEQQQELTDSAAVFENEGDLLSTEELDLEETDSDQIAESIALEATTDSEQVGHVASDSSSSTHDPTVYQPDEYSIPDLNLSEEAVHGGENSNSTLPVKDKSSLSDVSNDLGELRFASED